MLSVLARYVRARWRETLIVGLAALVLIGNGFLARETRRAADARATVAAERAVSERAAAQAERAARDAARNDSLARVADSLARLAARRADSLARVNAALRGRFTARASLAPDTCAAVIATADSALAGDSAEIAQLHVALDSSGAASAARQHALDSLTSANAALASANARLDAAANRLAHNTGRPSLLARLTPSPGIGGAAGYDPIRHQPALVLGVTFGWRL